MASPERLRAYAVRLFAMALRARENGEDNFADRLAIRAAEHLDEADMADKPITQQQQQPQPDKE